MGIEVTRVYTDPYVGDPLNHKKDNTGEWQEIKLNCKISNSILYSQNNTLNVMSSNFLVNMDNSDWNKKGFGIGDIITVSFIYIVGGVLYTNVIVRTVVDIQGALLEYDGVDIIKAFGIMPGERSVDSGGGVYVDAEIKEVSVSTDKRPDGIDITYGHLSNIDSPSAELNSYIDSTKTAFRVNGLNSLVGSKSMIAIGKQSGMSIHSYDIEFISKIGSHTYEYEITFKTLNNSFFDVDISGIENKVFPEVLLNENCLTDNFDIEAQTIAGDPNVFVTNNKSITAIKGNTGFINESYNGGINDFTVDSYSYETVSGDPLTELSYGSATVVKATISGIQNLTVGSSKFSSLFIFLPKADKEFKELNTPFHKNTLMNTGGLNAGTDTFLLVANGSGPDVTVRQGYSPDGLTRMDVSHVKFEQDGANVLFEARYTPTASFKTKFDNILPANKTYFLGVSCADHTLSTANSNRVMLSIDDRTMSLTETPLGAFGFTNLYIANYETKANIGNAVANVFPQDNFASKLSFTIDLNDNISFSDMDFRIELVNTVTGESYLLDSFIADLSEENTSIDGTQEFNFLDSRGFLIDDSTNDKNEVTIIRNASLDVGTVRAYSAYIGLKCRYEDWIENKSLPNDVFNATELNNGFNNFWKWLDSTVDWSIKYVIETSAVVDGISGVYKDTFDVVFKNYNSNEKITGTPRFYRQLDNTLISDAILKAGEIVRLEVDFELLPNVFYTGWDSTPYIEFQVEENDGGGWKTAFQFSDRHKTQPNSPYFPIDTYTYLKIDTISATKFTASCLIDGDKLPVVKYRLRAEIKNKLSGSVSSILFNGGNQYLEADNVECFGGDNTIGTFNGYFKVTDSTPASDETLVSYGDTNADEYLKLTLQTSGKLQLKAVLGGVTQFDCTTDITPLTNGIFANIVVVQDGVEPKIHVDNVDLALTFVTSTDKTIWTNGLSGLDNFTFGALRKSSTTSEYADVIIDEFSEWAINFNTTELTELYNGGCPYNLVLHSQAFKLRSWYRMGDGANDTISLIYDYSKYNHTKFDGTTEYGVIVGSRTDGGNLFNYLTSDVFSVSVWAKLEDYTSVTSQSYVGNNGKSGSYSGLGFGPLNNGGSTNAINCYVAKKGISFIGRTTTVDNVITDNEWHHIVISSTHIVGQTKIYVDGVSVALALDSKNVTGGTPSYDMEIGAAATATHGSKFNGCLCKVAFFNTNLSASDVTELYNIGRVLDDYGTTAKIGNMVWFSELDQLNPIDTVGTYDLTSVNMDRTNVGYNDATPINMVVGNIVSDKPC